MKPRGSKILFWKLKTEYVTLSLTVSLLIIPTLPKAMDTSGWVKNRLHTRKSASNECYPFNLTTWATGGRTSVSSSLVPSCECDQPAGIFSLPHRSLILNSEQTEVEQTAHLTCSGIFPVCPLAMLMHCVHCTRVPGEGGCGVTCPCVQAQPCAPGAGLPSCTGDHWHLHLSILVTPFGTARIALVPRLFGFLWAHWAHHHANHGPPTKNSSLCNRSAHNSDGRELGVGREFPSQDTGTQSWAHMADETKMSWTARKTVAFSSYVCQTLSC